MTRPRPWLRTQWIRALVLKTYNISSSGKVGKYALWNLWGYYSAMKRMFERNDVRKVKLEEQEISDTD